MDKYADDASDNFQKENEKKWDFIFGEQSTQTTEEIYQLHQKHRFHLNKNVVLFIFTFIYYFSIKNCKRIKV